MAMTASSIVLLVLFRSEEGGSTNAYTISPDYQSAILLADADLARLHMMPSNSLFRMSLVMSRQELLPSFAVCLTAA